MECYGTDVNLRFIKRTLLKCSYTQLMKHNNNKDRKEKKSTILEITELLPPPKKMTSD